MLTNQLITGIMVEYPQINTKWGPHSIANLVYDYKFTRVCDTYNRLVNGVYLCKFTREHNWIMVDN